jgi:hypothetical protein
MRLETWNGTDWDILQGGGSGAAVAAAADLNDPPDQYWGQVGACVWTINTPGAGHAGILRMTIENPSGAITFTNTIIWKGGAPAIIGTKQLFEFYWNGVDLIGEYTNLA